MTKRLSILLLFMVWCMGCQSTPTTEHDILGVWQIKQIELKSKTDFSINENPLPSQTIFTHSHYSLVWIPGTDGMRRFQKQWFPTDAEKIQRYDEIVVNAGTYTKTDSIIILKPAISRVPEFMGGGKLLYEYHIKEDTLWLTAIDEYSYDGVQAPWAAVGNRISLKMVRMEELFLK